MARKPNSQTVADQAESFRRVAEKRVTMALDRLDRIERMAGTGTYRWTDEQLAAIESVLSAKVGKVMAAFRERGAQSMFTFGEGE